MEAWGKWGGLEGGSIKGKGEIKFERIQRLQVTKRRETIWSFILIS